MIEYKTGNILKDSSEALTNPVNCCGVMGRGLAKQFKQAFPENYAAYNAACARHEVLVGNIFVYKEVLGPYILNFPTKRHWRGSSKLLYITSGLVALVREIQSRNIQSVAIPALGCGLGGLRWPEVHQQIRQALIPMLRARVVIYKPGGFR